MTKYAITVFVCFSLLCFSSYASDPTTKKSKDSSVESRWFNRDNVPKFIGMGVGVAATATVALIKYKCGVSILDITRKAWMGAGGICGFGLGACHQRWFEDKEIGIRPKGECQSKPINTGLLVLYGLAFTVPLLNPQLMALSLIIDGGAMMAGKVIGQTSLVAFKGLRDSYKIKKVRKNVPLLKRFPGFNMALIGGVLYYGVHYLGKYGILH